MTTTTDLNREERLDQVIADYLRAMREGQAPSRDQLLDTHPDLASDLSEFFADQDRFKRLAAPLRQAALPVGDLPLPRRFGNYELLAEIARGGMGVVYRARQCLDPQGNFETAFRPVALKFLLGGAVATDSELRRFRTEAETVASLDHPQIIPIYEVGVYEGRWFLSMKLVEGGHLGQHRERYKSDPRATAELLAVIADTVHHAHQRGILHRDLKPSNILLERRDAPQQPGGNPGWFPYVSDFGLARRLPTEDSSLSISSIHGAHAGVPGSTACRAPVTHTGEILGTPSYMAPEQASGQPGASTVAADVYGLGAILYELLTGRPPFQGSNHLDTILQVLHHEPAQPRQIAAGVPRDLETIALKCLRKEPARRYGSAREVAEDLRRWLRGEPILARPVKTGERLLRWIRRQPVIAGLALALAGSLLLGLALTGWQWYRAEQHLTQAQEARQRAEEQRAAAERLAQEAEDSRQQAQAHFTLAHQAVNQFTSRVNEELEDIPGLQQKRRRLLENALKYYEQFLKERGRTIELVREQADTWSKMAQIHSSSGERDKALAAFRQARSLYLELHERDPKDPTIRRELARTANNIAVNVENLEQARAGFQESLDLLNRFLEDTPGDALLLSDKANRLANLGNNSRSRGQVDEARGYYKAALAIQEQQAKQFPYQDSFQADLASTLRNLAVLLSHQGKHGEETLALYRRTCKLREKLAKKQPDNYNRQSDLAFAYQSLSTALRDNGELQAAMEPLKRALEVRERLVKANPGVPRFLADLAHTCTSLGVLTGWGGDRSNSLPHHQRARDLLQRTIVLNPAPHYRQELSLAWFNIGASHGALNRRVEERQAFQQSRELLEELVKENPDKLDYRCDLGRTMSNLGLNLGFANRNGEALLVLHEGLQAMRPAFAKAPQILGYRQVMNSLLGNLSEVERSLNHPAESAAAILERQQLWPDNPEVLYRSACELMRTAARVGRPRSDLTDPEKRERQGYWDLALGSLQRAAKCGFKDADRMQKERDLEPLWSREDYQKLLASLTMK